MQAIGMIETKGLLAIIEACDAMVKSANVNILEKVYVGGGLVSVTVTGDVGAVKSAVDAGVSAVNRLDEKSLVSHHVIARPHYDLKGIMETTPAIEREKAKKEVELNFQKEQLQDKILEESITLEDNISKEVTSKEESIEELKEESETEVLGVEDKDIEIENLEIESSDIEENENIQFLKESIVTFETNLSKEEVDNVVEEKGLDRALELLGSLKVSKVRKLAKEYKDFELTSKAISKIDKKSLISKFKEHYKK